SRTIFRRMGARRGSIKTAPFTTPRSSRPPTPTHRCHRPAQPGDPAFQRRLWLNREAAAYWVPRSRLRQGFGGQASRGTTAVVVASRATLRLLLHVLDVGEDDALGAFPGVAEIELVLGHEHGVAVDVVGDAGAVGGDEGLQLFLVLGGDPARQ